MPSVLTLLFVSPVALAADYTGDGIDDLVVGVPERDLGGVTQPGAIEVIRGGTGGLSGVGDAFIHQDTMGVDSANETNELFGYALGAGDVDDDGTDDVIVGGPGELVSGLPAGTVWRLELAPTRSTLRVTSSQAFSQASSGVTGSAEDGDLFAQAIAVADFDGDGYDDVVVGIPGEDVGTIVDAGAVVYLRGGAGGLTTSGGLYYDQSVSNVSGNAEANDAFGYSLAAGDFNADGFADLAIGVPWEDWGGTDEGSVHVMYGTSSGPGVVTPGDELLTAGEGATSGSSDDYNNCGWAVAVGDVDDDGYDDLAIGCPGYTVGSGAEAGAVLLVYGSFFGLAASEIWSQDTPGVAGTAEDYDHIGRALTTGDFDGDGCDDLAIGAPTENYGSYTDNGIVQVLMGSSLGLTDVGDVLLAQDTGSTVYGRPHDYDHWGQTLTSGDYDDDGRDELVVGSPSDTDAGEPYSGVVNVFPGSASGPSVTGDQMFHQDRAGIDDSVEAGDWFGTALR
jgi:hypothetical protein